jgi:pimeloyl-ACP methyl ester carboxylesterase
MANHISGPLHAEVTGKSGPVMLFVHSYPDDRRLWMFQTAHFSATFRTIAVDLAGFGNSPAAQEGITLADHAAACWEAVDRVGGGPVIIHGNSMGSEVAMWMADQRPQRTACIILSGFGFLPDLREHQLQRKLVCRAKGAGHRREMVLQHFPERLHATRLVQYYVDLICETSDADTLESLVRNAQALADADASLYPRLNVPTLMITADEDPARESGGKLHGRIRGAQLVCLKGAGHACNFEVPWAYDAAVIDYLKEKGLYPE